MLRSHKNLHLKWHTTSTMSVQRRNGQQTLSLTWLYPTLYRDLIGCMLLLVNFCVLCFRWEKDWAEAASWAGMEHVLGHQSHMSIASLPGLLSPSMVRDVQHLVIAMACKIARAAVLCPIVCLRYSRFNTMCSTAEVTAVDLWFNNRESGATFVLVC